MPQHSTQINISILLEWIVTLIGTKKTMRNRYDLYNFLENSPETKFFLPFFSQLWRVPLLRVPHCGIPSYFAAGRRQRRRTWRPKSKQWLRAGVFTSSMSTTCWPPLWCPSNWCALFSAVYRWAWLWRQPWWVAGRRPARGTPSICRRRWWDWQSSLSHSSIYSPCGVCVPIFLPCFAGTAYRLVFDSAIAYRW